MNSIDAMRIFVRVAELASFTQAAESLGLPKSSVSTTLQKLEAELATQLLHRTTRRVRMTADGQQFYERCRDLLADLDDAQTMFQRSAQSLSGRLRVDMSSGMARNLVIPVLPAFMAAHPALQLELSCSDRRVDVVREGFDCVVRVGTVADSSLIARPLGAYEILNCASPAYLQTHGTPQTLDGLSSHRMIHYASAFGGAADGWECRDDSGVYRTLPMAGSLVVNNTEAYQAACLAGLGLIQAPVSGVRALLDSGALVEVLPQYRAEPMPVTLLYPQRRNLSRRVRVFMDWLEQTLTPSLMPIR